MEKQMRDRSPGVRLQMVCEMLRLGLWDYDCAKQSFDWNIRAKELFGFSPSMPITLDVVEANIHPEDREKFHRSFMDAFHPGCGGYALEFRTLNRYNQHSLHLMARGKVIFDRARMPRFLLGVSM